MKPIKLLVISKTTESIVLSLMCWFLIISYSVRPNQVFFAFSIALALVIILSRHSSYVTSSWIIRETLLSVSFESVSMASENLNVPIIRNKINFKNAEKCTASVGHTISFKLITSIAFALLLICQR